MRGTPTNELLVYYGEGRVAWWPLQDAGGDVVAVCAPGGSGEGYQARVVAQQRYDAYGQVIARSPACRKQIKPSYADSLFQKGRSLCSS